MDRSTLRRENHTMVQPAKEIVPKEIADGERNRAKEAVNCAAREMGRRETEEEAKRERLDLVFTAQRIKFSN